MLFGIYLYMGIFFVICLGYWIWSGEEPTALIAGVSTCVGVESLAAGFIRIEEMRQYRTAEQKRDTRNTHHTSGDTTVSSIAAPEWGEK